MTTAATSMTSETSGNLPTAPLPMLRVQSPTDRILQALQEASRRARAGGSGGVTELRFTTRLKTKLLWVFVVVLLLSIWPGLPITESLLASMFPTWHWLWGTAAWWYLPLSIIGAPWAVWSALKKSKAELAVSAIEMIGKIQKELGAQRIDV